MSLTDLRNRSKVVRDETQFKANTASRIGQILMDIVDYLITLVNSSHSHANKSVLDQLADSVGGTSPGTDGKLTYQGKILETSSDITVSTWIDPPVIKIIPTLPVSASEGDRYIEQGTGRIFTWGSGSFVLDPATDPAPAESSAVIVRYNSADELINAIHIFESGVWINRNSEFNFDESRFITAWDNSKGRRLIPLTGSPNDIIETGRYYSSDNVVGNPLYSAAENPNPPIVYYFHDNHNDINAYQYAVGFDTAFRKFDRRKRNGVWSSWTELNLGTGGDFATEVNNASEKIEIVNDDLFGIRNSVGGLIAKVKWSSIKAKLEEYFDTVYTTFSGSYNDLTDKPNLSSLHTQNTDYKVKGYEIVFDPTTSINLAEYPGVNTFRIRRISGEDTYEISLLGISGSNRFEHLAKIIIDSNDTNTYRFTGGHFKAKSISNDIILQAGEFLYVEGIWNDPTETIYEISSSKDRADGGGWNPFNQELNTTNDAIFNSVISSSQEGERVRLALYDIDGELISSVDLFIDENFYLNLLSQLKSPDWVGVLGRGDVALLAGEDGVTKTRAIKSLSEVIQDKITMVNDLGEIYEWRTVGDQFIGTKIS